MNRERFIKPKIDKNIQLYSKKAKPEENVATIGLISISIENGGFSYPSNQTATINAPVSGTQPTIALTITNGTITNAVLSNYTTAVYNTPPIITIPQTTTTSVKSIEIVDAGSGYTIAPQLRFSYPPTARQAVITGDINNITGVLQSLTIVDGGLGYITAPSIFIDSTPDSVGDIQAQVTLIVTGGSVTGYTITNGGYYSAGSSAVVIVGPPSTSHIATATCTINAQGEINSVTITNQGLNYSTPPEITIIDNGEDHSPAILKSYLYLGYGANLSLNYQYNPSVVYKYTWELDTPVEVNENALIQLIERQFYNIPSNDKGKIIVVRMHDISTKSVVNTKNIGNNTDFNSGIIVDIGKEDRLLPNEIILEVNQQVINRITLSLNHDISGYGGFHSQIEFLLILKITEKEPTNIEYGTLNNINYLQ